jgi:hypothetical protein
MREIEEDVDFLRVDRHCVVHFETWHQKGKKWASDEKGVGTA